MTKTNNSARLVFASRLVFTLVTTTLAACSQDNPEQEEIRIRAISAESAFPMYEADSAQGTPSSQRLLLDFDDSPFHTSPTYNFFRLGDHLSYATDQGHRHVGSMRVSNRAAAWEGPLLTLPPLQTKPYTVSMWVKLINTQRTATAKLVLMQVADSGGVSVPLAEVEISPGSWQKVEGTIAGVASEDKLHALTLEVDGADIDYLIDDVLVEEAGSISEFDSSPALDALKQATPAQGIVANGDVESGLEHWTYQGGKISLSKQQAYSGEHSLLITDRTEPWHAPAVMLNGLEDNQLYRFSIFARLTAEYTSAPVQLTLKQVIDGEAIFLPIANTRVTNSGWTEVAGNLSVPNFSNSEEVSLYLESIDPVASYYVDNLTVERQ